MKKCPQCGRDYDLSMIFCLDDGVELVYGPRTLGESATAIFPASVPKTAVLSTDLPVGTANSIAVLPFTHMSSAEDNEYFCDGLAEELINALSKIDGLKVAARTSAFFFKGKETDISEIAKKLGVKAVLEGSVRKSGDRMRITVQLINASDGYHLWSERYDREMKDIFDVQDEITSAVVTSLKVKLLGDRNASQKRGSAEAYEAYLRGRYSANKQTATAVRKAEEYFKRAIELDPDYALAYAALADTYVLQVLHAGEPVVETIERARTAALESIRIDEHLPEGHAAHGFIKTLFEWDWAGSERELRRAIELNPSYATTYQTLGARLCIAGRFEESLDAYRRAAELDPLSPSISEHLGWPYYYSRDYDSAIRQFRRTLEMEPDYQNTRFRLGLAYFQKGMHEEAVKELKNSQAISNDRDAVAWLGYAAGCMGRLDEARAKLAELTQRAKTEYVPPYDFAIVHLGLNETDAAFEWLEKGARENDYWLIFVNVDPVLDSLRSDSRFKELSILVGLLS